MFFTVKRVFQYGLVNNYQVNIDDLAALTAYSGHEFALFDGGSYKVVVHGGATRWNIPQDLWEKIKNEKLILEAHSHPTFERLTSSKEERETLKLFTWQTKSTMIDLSGSRIEFTSSEADWFNQILGVK